MGLKVCKFGGTSLASAEQFRKVADIVLADRDRKIVVVSAPGKRSKSDTKVTDLLIHYAETKLAGEGADHIHAAIVERFAEIVAGLELPRDQLTAVEAILKARSEGDRSHRERYIDSIKALGEEFSARLMAAFLNKQDAFVYVDPKDAGLLLSDEPGNAQVLPQAYTNLRPLRDRPERMVFPGFFGYAANGNLVAFPRGGSDITGAIVAAAVEADVYENFTDVDNVFAADPRIVERPAAIHAMTYSEMRELSYAGFSVLHDEALQPAFNAKIPVHIRNTNNPQSRGTLITLERNNSGELPVVGVAGSADFCTIFLSKYLMNREKGFGRRLLQIIEDAGLSYEHTPSGIDHISVIIRESTFTPEAEERVLSKIRAELQPDKLLVKRGIALVMIVGDGMTEQIGIAKRATGALADHRVNLEMINQGASENSIMFGIRKEHLNEAIVALHNEFFPR